MKFELVYPETIQLRESQGLVKDIYDPVSTIRQPLSEYKVMLDLIHRSPTLATAYDILVDFATYRGYDFIGGNKAKRDELRILFDELDFKRVLPNIIYTLLYYGDCFLELRKNDSAKPNELWVLETTEMRIIYDVHGKVEGYVQRTFDMNGMKAEEILKKEKSIIPKTEGGDGKKTYGIFFKPDEVIHFRMKWIGSQVYSYHPNEPIAVPASTRLYAGNYLMNIFINMPPRYVAHLSGISKLDYDKAKLEFQSAKTNYKKTIAFSRSDRPDSKLQIQKLDAPYDKDLIEVMKYLDTEILKITRVPRTWVQESGVENRGIGESLMLPFEVRVQALHRNVLEPQINAVLLKQLGYYKKSKDASAYLEFRFNEVSRKGETEILQNAGLLRDMGLKPEGLVRYLDCRGILGTDPEDFEMVQLQKNMELNPSRQRMDKGVDSMTTKLDSTGTSRDSAKKMRAET